MSGSGFRTVAYFVNWAIYGRKHFPHTLPADKLTHVLYAFAKNKEDGTVFMTDGWADTDIRWQDLGDTWNDGGGNNLYGCLKQLNLHKRRHRHFKVLLSVGGWSYSSEFRAPCATEAGRRRFADSCVDLLANLGFDGIDIDWEYPANPQEGEHYVLLLQTVRAALDNYAKSVPGQPHFSLTVASPAGQDNLANLNLRAMDQYLDFWNLMAYDFAGSWDKNTGHQANLYPCTACPQSTPFSISKTLDLYAAGGVPSSKIVLGMPLYGRAFENTDGPGQSFNGVGNGSWENGVFDYKDLPLAGADEVMVVDKDNQAERCVASYCYDKAKRKLVSYDSKDMAVVKAKFIREKGLGGGMWWESSGDKPGDQSLITTVFSELGGTQSLLQEQNCIDYPHSKYDNLREGFPKDLSQGK